MYQLTGSTQPLGVVAGASTGPMPFLSTWGGWVADRHPKRTVIVIAQVVSMGLSLLLAWLTWSGLIQPWQIITIAGLGGVVMAFEIPERQAFVIEMTSREDLPNAIALNRNFYTALHRRAGAGFGMMLFMSTSNSAIQMSVPDDMRGRVLGVWALIIGGITPFGSLVAGGLARIVGAPLTIIIGAIICILASAVTLCVGQRRDQTAADARNERTPSL